MKRLLSLLSIIGLTSTITTPIVSCASQPTEQQIKIPSYIYSYTDNPTDSEKKDHPEILQYQRNYVVSFDNETIWINDTSTPLDENKQPTFDPPKDPFKNPGFCEIHLHYGINSKYISEAKVAPTSDDLTKGYMVLLQYTNFPNTLEPVWDTKTKFRIFENKKDAQELVDRITEYLSQLHHQNR